MKQETIIIDIDGVIFPHLEKGARAQWYKWHTAMPNVGQVFDKLEAQGYYIILITARKWCLRRRLEHALEEAGIFYDQLIMGVGSGRRIIVNDIKPGGQDACEAINIQRNGDLLQCLKDANVLV